MTSFGIWYLPIHKIVCLCHVSVFLDVFCKFIGKMKDLQSATREKVASSDLAFVWVTDDIFFHLVATTIVILDAGTTGPTTLILCDLVGGAIIISPTSNYLWRRSLGLEKSGKIHLGFACGNPANLKFEPLGLVLQYYEANRSVWQVHIPAWKLKKKRFNWLHQTKQNKKTIYIYIYKPALLSDLLQGGRFVCVALVSIPVRRFILIFILLLLLFVYILTRPKTWEKTAEPPHFQKHFIFTKSNIQNIQEWIHKNVSSIEV